MKQPFHNPVDLKHSRHWNLFSTWGGFLNMFHDCLSPSCCLNMTSVTSGSLLWHHWHTKIMSLINSYYQTKWLFKIVSINLNCITLKASPWGEDIEVDLLRRKEIYEEWLWTTLVICLCQCETGYSTSGLHMNIFWYK